MDKTHNSKCCEYKRLNRKTGEVTSTTIRYKMLYRNASKAKVGLCNFINEKLYEDAYDWLTMGLGKLLPKDNAKIVADRNRLFSVMPSFLQKL